MSSAVDGHDPPFGVDLIEGVVRAGRKSVGAAIHEEASYREDVLPERRVDVPPAPRRGAPVPGKPPPIRPPHRRQTRLLPRPGWERVGSGGARAKGTVPGDHQARHRKGEREGEAVARSGTVRQATLGILGGLPRMQQVPATMGCAGAFSGLRALPGVQTALGGVGERRRR
jgi:hypothetical protein